MKSKARAADLVRAARAQSIKFPARLARFNEGQAYTPDELRYSETARCTCGAGLAHPLGAPSSHYWECSALLTATARDTDPAAHSPRFLFGEFNIREETDTLSTRPRP